MQPLASALAACLACAPCAGADDYSQWTGSAELFLDTTPDGAGVDGDVLGFPLLVRLGPGEFDFSGARGRGQDIRFSKADGTHLPYQIDHWDSAGGSAAIWVKLDTVKGNREDQSIRMHWGHPSAADSSRGAAVFDSAAGHVAVWHLGGPAGNRPNAVPGGWQASPQGYGADVSAPGMIGMCDSLRNDAGDEGHLTVGDGYGELAQGFHFSAWVYPTAAGNRARLIDLGNGPGLDNIVIGRTGTSDGLFVDIYNSGARSAGVDVPGAFALGQWQLIDVTVSGLEARVYRNGALVRLDTLTQPISGNRRAYNYIGKSNWHGDAYFQGRLDEVRLARRARGADWIRLGHANQKSGQSLVSFRRAPPCQARFAVPPDTAADEGQMIELAGSADCATGFSWAAVSGPAPRILDPGVKALQVRLPRVAGDTSLVYRFTALYPDSAPSREVRVRVREAVPDPVFALPAVQAWSGADSLLIAPEIANLAAIRASRDSALRWEWTLEGAAADTAWRAGGLLLKKLVSAGRLAVTLCLDNGGDPACRTLELEAGGGPTALDPSRTAGASSARAAVPGGPRRDASGRLLPGSSRALRRGWEHAPKLRK